MEVDFIPKRIQFEDLIVQPFTCAVLHRRGVKVTHKPTGISVKRETFPSFEHFDVKAELLMELDDKVDAYVQANN